MGWIFREQTNSDYGVDAHVELVENDLVTGKLIAIQIKGGPYYFRDWSESAQCWTFRSDLDHLRYWLGHVLPVVVVIADPETQKAYWQVVAERTARETEKGFALSIPLDQPFDASACDDLRRIAARDDQRVLADFAHNLELLPPGTEEALRSAHQTDPVAAATVADLLAQGRVQPALTAEAIVARSPEPLRTVRRRPSFGLPSPSTAWRTMPVDREARPSCWRRTPEVHRDLADAHSEASFSARLARSSRSVVELERARDDGAVLVASVGLAMLDVPPNSALPVPIPEVVSPRLRPRHRG